MTINDPMVLYLIQMFKKMFVPVEKGKGLSTNDFTDAYKTKVDELSEGGGGGGGADGEDGVTFTPSVSTAGVISWTNNGGLANPSPVNIKGPKGDQGSDYVLTQEDKEEIADLVTPSGDSSEKYAVGDIFITTRNGNPSSLLGYGTWQQIKDSFLLAAGDTYAQGDTGGEVTHTLTEDELPEVSGTVDFRPWSTGSPYSNASGAFSSLGETSTAVGSFATSSTQDGYRRLKYSFGGGEAHNNMPPFLAVNMWIRTA